MIMERKFEIDTKEAEKESFGEQVLCLNCIVKKGT